MANECYVCKKEIRESQKYYAIGKDKKGKELFRHRKCKPYNRLRKTP